MKVRRQLLNSLLLGLATVAASGQTSVQRPRLVVGIVVDQLRTDYLDYLRPLFGKDGFRTLMDSGVYMKDVDYKVSGLDKISGTALVYTGAYPSTNGIASAKEFDSASRLMLPALGSGSALSPEHLSLSTISDEVVIEGIGLGAVHAVAADPQQAVILAGHAAGSALWIDPDKGNWTTSAYYKDLPYKARNISPRNSISARVDTMKWEPLLPLDRYPGIPPQKKYYPFRYTFPSSDRTSYTRLAETPVGNREVTDMALEYLGSLNMGSRGEAIDMLSIGYSLAPYKDVRDGDSRIELEDAYIRLDADISRILDAVRKGPGIDNTLIYIFSTGYFNDAVPDDPKYRIPSGEFSSHRAESLLNSYLSAKYGNGDYVDSFDGRELYLSSAALRNAVGTSEQITADAAQFLGRMSGVARAITVSEIIGSANPDLEKYRLGINPATAGDIIVDVKPGWTLVNDLTVPARKIPVRDNAVNIPALILAPGVTARKIENPVEAVALAPTVTQILRIRSPNGAAARPRPLI